MRNIRIYQNAPLAIGMEYEFDKAASRHLNQVLRLAAGDLVSVFNGDGNDYLGKISESSKNRIAVYIDGEQQNSTESPLKVNLFQGVSKGDRMDTAVQKSVELGVHTITPVLCERTVVKMDAERMEKRLQHWTNIIISACEQSGRSVVPVLHKPVTFNELFSESSSQLRLILQPDAALRISQVNISDHEIDLYIGPEGGFSDREIELASKAGATSVQMGQRVLRTETAPIAAISALQALHGDF